MCASLYFKTIINQLLISLNENRYNKIYNKFIINKNYELKI